MAFAAKTSSNSPHPRRSSSLSGTLNALASSFVPNRNKYRQKCVNIPIPSPSAGGTPSSCTSPEVTAPAPLKQGTRPRRLRIPLTPAQQVAAATRALQLADYNIRLLIDDIDLVLALEDWEVHLHACASAKVFELNMAATNVAVLKYLRYSPSAHVSNIWHGFVRVAWGRRELDRVGIPATKEWMARCEVRAGIDDVLNTLVWLRTALA